MTNKVLSYTSSYIFPWLEWYFLTFHIVGTVWKMFAVKEIKYWEVTTETKKNLLTIATILLLPFYKCLRLNIIFQDRRGKMFCRSNAKSKRKKKTKKQKLKEQWFLEEEAKNHCELIAALMWSIKKAAVIII